MTRTPSLLRGAGLGGLALAALLSASCFPDLPNAFEITNLRVMAVRSDPAVAVLNTFPLPVITVEALVVDPQDPELDNVAHSWSIELPDGDFEGREQLEALLPAPPHGPSIELDLSLFLAREGGWAPAVLPLRYRAVSEDDHRDAVKLVSFLVPDIVLPPGGGPPGDDDDSAGDDDDSAGDDDDSAGDDDDDDDFTFGDDDDSAAVEQIPPEQTAAYNENPVIVSIERLDDGATVWTAADGELPGPAAPLYVGAVAAGEGLHLKIELADNTDPDELSVMLAFTAGVPGLPPDPADDDPFAGGPFGGGGDDDEPPDSPVIRSGDGDGGFGDEAPPREFGWTAPAAGDDAPLSRLFFIIRDESGGQTWQELRPEPAP